jgi:hypothetical protein
MSRCVLGPKKHARCEQIGGRQYDQCLVRGGDPHGWALCVWMENGQQYADRINYQTGTIEPDVGWNRYGTH